CYLTESSSQVTVHRSVYPKEDEGRLLEKDHLRGGTGWLRDCPERPALLLPSVGPKISDVTERPFAKSHGRVLPLFLQRTRASPLTFFHQGQGVEVGGQGYDSEGFEERTPLSPPGPSPSSKKRLKLYNQKNRK